MSSNPYAAIPAYEDVYGGEYFSPADLHDGPVTARITNLSYDEVFCVGAGKKKKIILTLAGQKKKICVNKTSAKALAFAFSKDFQKWKGQTVAATGGEVNGKAAVLLRPVKASGSQKPSSSTPTEALPSDTHGSSQQQATLDTGGSGPTEVSSRTASKEEAGKAALAACSGDRAHAVSLWNMLVERHGAGNYNAFIADCALPEDK